MLTNKEPTFELLVDSVQDANIDWDEPFRPKLEIVGVTFSGKLVWNPQHNFKHIIRNLGQGDSND